MKQYHCPVELTLDVVGGRWRVLILAHLKQGPLRYGQLRRLIPDVSEKMLTQRLRELEADGLVLRDATHEPELRTDYRLSPEGETLAPVLQGLYDWGLARAERTGVVVTPPGD
ncbi:winged helix-turn-helix transcriptional regulator [Kutzneria kofuensis]|uniref:DNA-binding HxlR family transcriptional regulator n=1 Tax=Kutzneria kofuensis TaxID=103725 RepID=A0A7W9NF97_9PSEU|nr:helix-turn-helix domain-containing protein [Kutzneria kofuensis]MBB5891172.1 DNA-binding HxlR family transcriptional regulator [Kutzneria kofuensis]